MEWDLVIERNREALLRLVALVVAGLGIAAGGSVSFVTRRAHSAAQQVLRPAESAIRRLIVMRARGMVLSVSAPRPMPKGILRGNGAQRAAQFRLLDTLKRFETARAVRRTASGPRISFPGLSDPVFEPVRVAATPDDLVSATQLCRRLQALQTALDDLPKQARRLARWRARRDLERKRGKLIGRVGPLRPGWPPGHRKRGTDAVDDILADCHIFACRAQAPPNTS